MLVYSFRAGHDPDDLLEKMGRFDLEPLIRNPAINIIGENTELDRVRFVTNYKTVYINKDRNSVVSKNN